MFAYLKNSSIGGGSVVDLGLRKLTSSWDVYTQDKATPGKTTLPWDPHEVDHTGIGNQRFIVGGHFVEGSEAMPKTGSSSMQVALMGSFCNMGSPSWFISDANVFLCGIASIQVMPSAPKFTADVIPQDALTHIDYDLTLTETKAW